MKQAGRATIFELADMIGGQSVSTHAEDAPNVGTGFPARAVPDPFSDGLLARLRSAWEVIAGRAYPVRWPKAGELERALRKP